MTVAAVSAILLAAWPALLGLLLGGMTGLLIGIAVGLALGAIYGHTVYSAGPYEMHSASCIGIFIIDHSWSALNTLVGALFLGVNLLIGNRIDRTFTQGRSIVGLQNGVLPGYATTIGTVQAGTGMGIDAHEAVHVTQARLFGPLYLPLVVVNYILATVAPYWLLYHDRASRPITSLVTYFRRGVYPHVWNEEWAYKVEGTPPL